MAYDLTNLLVVGGILFVLGVAVWQFVGTFVVWALWQVALYFVIVLVVGVTVYFALYVAVGRGDG